MFEKFGEMSSAEEINALAENLFNEGDTESLFAMAKENGLDEEFAQAYMEGEIPEICDAQSAAAGKLAVEAQDLQLKEIMLDWMGYIEAQCLEDERFARAVRSKEKSLKGCIAAILKWSFANQIPIGAEIIKAAGIKAGKVTMGIPGMRQARKIIREYYGGAA